MSFSLKDDGDAIERRWYNVILLPDRFPNYEPLWIEHVVPITWRVVEPTRLYVRSAAPRPLKYLATYNYGIFIHLSAAHEQLEIANTKTDKTDETNAELFARTGIYTFYSRLYSAGQLVPMFLETIAQVVDKYRGTRRKTVKARLDNHSTGDLFNRYDVAFKTRTKDYRNPQVHNWGFPAIGRLIPRREYLSQWADKDLGELDKFLSRDRAKDHIHRQFVDAIGQAEEDLRFAESVVNDIWKVVLDELGTISAKDRYQKDQGRGLERAVPKLASELISAETVTTSGAVAVSKNR